MRHPLIGGGAALAALACAALSACGSSSSSSSASSSSAAASSSEASSSSSASISAAGGFCAQAAAGAANFAQIAGSFTGAGAASPGAAPDINHLKQLIGAETQLIDSLDSQAPGEIAAAFHTVRMALDTGNARIQSATSIQDLATAYTQLNTQAVQQAQTSIAGYLASCAGASVSASSSSS